MRSIKLLDQRDLKVRIIAQNQMFAWYLEAEYSIKLII